MTPELPPNPRAELEARVTAWLLGELSAEEAASVREMVAKDAELRRLQERLSQTLNLLRETVATPVGETPAQPAPLKLSPARREKLLAHFKTIAPKEFAPTPRRRMPSLMEWAAIAAIVVVLAGLLLPSLSKAKFQARRSFSMSNLAALQDGAATAKTPSPKRELLESLQERATTAKTASPRGEFVDGLKAPPAEFPVASPAATADYISSNQVVLPQTGEQQVAQENVQQNAGTPQLNNRAYDNGRLPIVTMAPRSAISGVDSYVSEGATNAVVSLNGWQGNQPFNQPIEPPAAAAPAPSGTAGAVGSTFDFTPPSKTGGVSVGGGFSAAPASESIALGSEQASKDKRTEVETLKNSENKTAIAKAWRGGTISGPVDTVAPAAAEKEAVREAVRRSPAPPAPADAAAPAGLFPGADAAVAPPAPTVAAAPAHGAEGMGRMRGYSALNAPKVAVTPIPAEAPAFGGAFADASAASNSGADRANTTTFAFNEGKQDGFKLEAPGAVPATPAPPPAESGRPRFDDLINGAFPTNVNLAYAHLASPAAATPAENATNSIIVNYALGTDISKDLSSLAAAGPDQEQVTKIPSEDKKIEQNDAPLQQAPRPAPVPQPEVLTRDNAFTTFSLNISDVAFKLAQASLQNGVMPEAASMRSEEFINAFDYRDPEPAPGAPIGFAWERAGDPFAHNRDFLRFSIKTAAQGRETGRPLNLVLLLDKSGSMERADRVEIIARALRVLASQLQPHDKLSVVVFARTARLFVDGVPGSEAGKIAKKLRDLTPEGGTNLEEAMRLAYATALRHYLANGENRVVLLTDGAANLGNVDPNALKQNVETNRKQGIALDCFGVGWDGYNDDLLETLSRAGNGRYGFINTPEEAATEFAGKLAGALRVAAADVKVQVEFNPNRVTSYRQIGYAKDQLKKEDFRNNNVKAAQIGVAESGNALYTVEINPAGEGPVGTVHVRFRVPGTSDYQEHEWTVPYTGSAVSLEKCSPAMRLAASAAAFAEWLAGSPFAAEVTPDRLLVYLNGVPQVYGADARPAKLVWMIRQAKSISGK